MRILFITPFYYPHIGGVECVVKSIAKRLTMLGREVTIVAGEPNIQKPKEGYVNGIKVIRWPTWAPKGAYSFPRNPSKFEKLVARLARNADALHHHSVHVVMAYHVWRAWREYCRNRTRFVLTPHYHGSGHTFIRSALWILWRDIVRKILREADVVHSVSEYEASLLRQDFGVDSVTIEHGVNEDVLNYVWRPENYMLYAGRIEKYKNIELAGIIVRELNEKHGESLELIVIGNGPYKKKLVKNLHRIGTKYRALPFQPRDKYLDYLSKAKALVNLSKREAYGLSVLEAIATGVPTIVVKPWGLNFSGRRKVFIVDLAEPIKDIARKVKEFLDRVPGTPRDVIPTWGRVVQEYLKRLYTT